MYVYNPSYNSNFSTHFLESINTSNILLMLVDSYGNKTKINPTEIKLMHVMNNIVNISVGSNKVLKLNFSTNTEAKLALRDLNTRLGLLKGRANLKAGLFDTLQVVIEHDYNDYHTLIDIDGDYTEIGFVMSKKPKPNSYIIVFINGMETELSSNGDRDSAPVYFSGDGGLTSKDFYENPVLMGDKLYWNSSYGINGEVFGMLDAGSRVAIYYLQDIMIEGGVPTSASNVVIEQQYNDFTIPVDIDITQNGVDIGLELTANPLRRSVILLFLNGQEVDIVSNGDKLSSPAYFSGDGGLTARDFLNNYVRDGDKLYWNCALYDNYNASDRLSMYYLINN